MNQGNDTATRLRRLLAILTWLAQEGEAPIDEVAHRFDLSPDALVTELEMAACCGVPPFTPDQLLEIVVTDDTVSTRVGTVLARPRRLSSAEGLALAASARALLAVPGSDADGALSRALTKLDQALGRSAIDVDLDRPALLDTVQAALVAGDRLAVTYYSASTDQTAERIITPLVLFASESHWYVDAHCDVADGIRRFRVDRMAAAAPIGPADPEVLSTGTNADGSTSLETEASAQPGVPTGGAFVPGPDSRTVRIAVDPAMSWLLESIPTAANVKTESGRIEWDVFVGGDAWLERLLLRLGPDADVVDPAADRALAAEAAFRILRRYRPSTA